MADPVIRLDKSKTFSICSGERTPDDPHYHVHFMQGGKLAGHIVLLPFDSNGNLVPDDGKTEAYPGINAEGKAVKFAPLYDKLMRDFLAAKLKKMSAVAQVENEIEEEGDDADDMGGSSPEDEVNFESWLRGSVRYQPHLLRAAMKKRYHKNCGKISDIIEELVLEEKLVPESELAPEIARQLPKRAA